MRQRFSICYGLYSVRSRLVGAGCNCWSRDSLIFLVADMQLYTLPCWSVRPSVHPSKMFFNYERFLHYCSYPTVRDWIAVYPALFSFQEWYGSKKGSTKGPQKNQKASIAWMEFTNTELWVSCDWAVEETDLTASLEQVTEPWLEWDCNDFYARKCF